MKKVSTVGYLVIAVIVTVVVLVVFRNTEFGGDSHMDRAEYSETVSPELRTEYVLAKTSTTTSKVKVFTGRYESNLLKIMSWLPERWDLVAVLKWSAYGNDINILGPIASRTVPAIGVISNEDAAALAPHNPKSILRIGPTNYEVAKDAVLKGLKVQEFIGTQVELDAVTRVAKENNTSIDASIYLFKHYGDPWGFEFDTAAELQHFVDSVDPEFVKVRDIFTHLVIDSEDTEASVNKKIQRFLSVACPVAVKIATTLAPDDPPIRVHWGASGELYRLINLETGKLELTPDLHSYTDVCMSHPKVNFGVRAGTATYSNVYGLPGLHNILWWTSKITKLYRTKDSNIAVVNVGTENGYPRFFQSQGNWGKVSIGGKLYPLAAAPQKQKIEVDIGKSPDKAIFIGTQVCLLCDNLSFDNFFKWAAIDTYNISMCATGARSHFAEATWFLYDKPHPSCKGPVVIVSSEDDDERD